MKTIVAFLLLSLPCAAQSPPDGVKLVHEVSQTVKSQFFDPRFGGADWPAATHEALEAAASCHTWPEARRVVTMMLGHLHASHTAYYSVDDPEYYQLLGIFASHPGGHLGEQMRRVFPEGQPRCPGIGILVDPTPEGVFVRGVLEGGPAEKAGLKRGDRIVAVDGQPFQSVPSFRGKSRVVLEVQSTAAGVARKVEVSVQQEGPDLFLDALKHSCRVIDWRGRKVAYVHAWSYAGDVYQEAIVDAVQQRFSGADGLILDLRDGWGGATPDFLNLFDPVVPDTELIFRNGAKSALAATWHKPVAMLIDGGSRSGKEILAYGFKKHHLGWLVGKPTAGAVLGGRPYLLDAGGVLYLAVADVRVDGERLEGHPVQPDVDVDRPLPYSQGDDPQLDAALSTLFRPRP